MIIVLSYLIIGIVVIGVLTTMQINEAKKAKMDAYKIVRSDVSKAKGIMLKNIATIGIIILLWPVAVYYDIRKSF